MLGLIYYFLGIYFSSNDSSAPNIIPSSVSTS
nr:MAG TPA: hypothetical protein [Caudoviricetes sp.]